MSSDIDWDKLIDEQEQFEKENPDPRLHPTGPLFQAEAEERLEIERERYEGGDNMALLGAIRICANHDLPLPDWASKAYIAAYDQVLRCHSRSWDEVFGKPYPGKDLEKLRERRSLRLPVYRRIEELRREDGRTIQDELFEDVGAEFGIKKTLCNQLYYEARRLLGY